MGEPVAWELADGAPLRRLGPRVTRAGTEGRDEYPGTAHIAAPTGAMWAVHERGPGYAVTVVGR